METVTEKALLARVRRKLSREGEWIYFSRRLDVGPYFIVDSYNVVTRWGIDLEKVAKELNCLADFETLIYPNETSKGG